MNRNEFYKQLMSEYSFDADKIKSNAKKGKFARQKSIPMFVGMTAAAAAIVVAVGTTLFTALGNNDGVTLIESGSSMLSATERLQRALDEIEKNAASSELRDVLVTFTEPLSPAQAQAVLTAYSDGSIPIRRLYFSDGVVAVGNEQIAEAFGGSGLISGAVVNCSGSVMALLQGNEYVFLVENVDESELNIIAPIDTDAAENSDITIPDYVPNIDTTPENASSPDGESVETHQGGSFAETEETRDAASESAESSEKGYASEETADVEQEPNFNESSESGGNVPENNTPAPEVTTAPDKPDDAQPEQTVQTAVLPDGVTLPLSAEKFSYETVYVNAKDAFFLSDTTFYVRTAEQVQLYTFDGADERLIAAADCRNAEICWVSVNGDSLIVSGTDSEGKRNQLYYIDSNGEQITNLNAEDTVMDGTLVGVGYNADSKLLVMCVKEYGRYYVCAESFTGASEPEYLETSFESSSAVTLMAVYGNDIYFAVADGSLTQIYKTDAEGNELKLLKTYENNPTITSNLAFTHGIIYPSSSSIVGAVEIFDPQTAGFISLGRTNASIDFGTNKHSFSDGGSFYTINGGEITSAGGITVIGRVEYRKSGSSLYAAAASSGKVRITSSSYTATVKSGLISFGDLSDSASAEIRAAVNGAIGINNAIAQGSCEKYGMTTPSLLSQSIDVYYSESAAQALRSKCGISPLGGAMRYNGSGLTAISVSDTVLSVSVNGNTASGILFVKAGSFGGKTAYVSYSIKLVKENGSWKLDNIIAA